MKGRRKKVGEKEEMRSRKKGGREGGGVVGKRTFENKHFLV